MTVEIPEETVAIGDSLVRFVEQEVVPLERSNVDLFSNDRTVYDESGRYVPAMLDLRRQVRMKSAAAGFYTMLAPAELGGGGLPAAAAVYLQALLARHCGPARHLVHHVVIPSPFTNGLSPVLLSLAPGLRDRYLPGIATGERTLCFGLSEPDAGSDAMAMRTRAVRDGDDWVITGTKQWITNSPYADYAVIFAAVDGDRRGITAFFVETATPGFAVTGVIPVMGALGGDTGIIALDGVRVSDANRMGGVGEGLAVAMRGINTGRLGMAATCIGYAEWALAQAIDYARTRRSFGKPIAEHQAIQFHLADTAMDIYAGRTMLADCAAQVDAGHPSRGAVAMVKAYATEMLSRCADRCIQVHGAMGLTNDLRLEAAYRFARTMRIPDGTAEIQRRTIAAELLNGNLSF